MAPEVLGGGRGDSRADVFALGVVLYEMATGKPPFAAESAIGLMYEMLNRAPAAPHGQNPAIPRGLEVVIAKALERDPARRYASASEVHADLRALRAPSRPQRAGGRRRGARGRVQSLAVLPLDNLSRDPNQEYFADGMTEALIADLAKIAGLRVISRTCGARPMSAICTTSCPSRARPPARSPKRSSSS